MADLNASNIQLELNVCLLHVVRPGREQTVTHVLVKVTYNKHIPFLALLTAVKKVANV